MLAFCRARRRGVGRHRNAAAAPGKPRRTPPSLLRRPARRRGTELSRVAHSAAQPPAALPARAALLPAGRTPTCPGSGRRRPPPPPSQRGGAAARREPAPSAATGLGRAAASSAGTEGVPVLPRQSLRPRDPTRPLGAGRQPGGGFRYQAAGGGQLRRLSPPLPGALWSIFPRGPELAAGQ